MKLAIIDGRIRRVIKVHDVAPTHTVCDVITGHRHQRVTSQRNPGSGFRRIVGEKNRWERYQPQINKRSVDNALIVDVNDWPTRSLDNLSQGQVDAYMKLVLPQVKVVISSGNPRTARTAPSIRFETVESRIKTEGLPALSQEDLDKVVAQVWNEQRDSSADRRRGSTGLAQALIAQRDADIRAAKAKAEELARREREAKAIAAAEQAEREVRVTNWTRSAKSLGWPDVALEGLETREGLGDALWNRWDQTLKFMSETAFDSSVHVTDDWEPEAATKIDTFDKYGEAPYSELDAATALGNVMEEPYNFSLKQIRAAVERAGVMNDDMRDCTNIADLVELLYNDESIITNVKSEE